MTAGIFLLDSDDRIVEMREEPYESEEVLQRLLASFPQLLAGDEFPGEEPRRWVLVTREAGVPDQEGAGGRWSLDHLFLDQGGIPTLVEVKRSSDTRARREVVAQMLDYAANAAVYWPAEQIREWFTATCEEKSVDPNEVLGALVGSVEFDPEEFWEAVRTNLRAGRLRLVFIADQIPRELQRIIEYLNEQMSDTEVLGVEIRQFRNGDQRTLVPRVIGQTAAAQQAKRVTTSRAPRQWDEEMFVADATERIAPEEVKVLRDLLDWSATWRSRLWWGKGKIDGSAVPVLDHDGQGYPPITLWSNGSVEIGFYWLAYHPPFDDPAARHEFRRRLNQISGVDLTEDVIGRRPNIRVSRLRPPESLAAFKAAVEWLVAEVRER
jgi:hypothetical protein